MHELTEHERRARERLIRDGQASGVRTQRQDLRRLVPVDQVLDREHLVGLMHQGPAGNRAFRLWQHFAAVGMRAEGYDSEETAAALEVPVAKLNELLAPITMWKVPEDVQRRFPLLYPETVEHHEPPERVPEHPREDYPFLNTNGYRVAGPLGPGMRTRTLGGNEPTGRA